MALRRLAVAEDVGQPLMEKTTALKMDAGVKHGYCSYSAVLISMFGGVRVEGPGGKTMVHPILVFLMVMPAFMVQLSTLMCLRVEADLHAKVYEDTAKDRLLLSLKIIMVAAMQLTYFEYMVTAARELCFVVNPLIWIDVKRPMLDDWLQGLDVGSHWLTTLYRYWVYATTNPFFLFPLALVTLFMKLLIGYLICVDSVSIILLATSVQEAIFDGMAITFLVDFAGVWWKMLTAVVGFDPIDDFTFLKAGVWRGERMESESHHCAWLLKCLFPKMHDSPKTLPEGFKSDLPPWVLNILQHRVFQGLRRGSGSKRAEQLSTFLVLFLVYAQQLQVVAFAIKTNVLPIARDVCTMWRWQTGHSTFFKRSGPIVAQVIHSLVFVDVQDELYNALEDDTSMCLPGGKFYRMMMCDRRTLFEEQPLLMFGGTLLIIVVLVVPQLVHTMGHSMRDDMRIRRVESKVIDDEDRIAALEEKIDSLLKR